MKISINNNAYLSSPIYTNFHFRFWIDPRKTCETCGPAAAAQNPTWRKSTSLFDTTFYKGKWSFCLQEIVRLVAATFGDPRITGGHAYHRFHPGPIRSSITSRWTRTFAHWLSKEKPWRANRKREQFPSGVALIKWSAVVNNVYTATSCLQVEISWSSPQDSVI